MIASPRWQNAAAVVLIGIAVLLAWRYEPPKLQNDARKRVGDASEVIVLRAKDPKELATRLEGAARTVGLVPRIETQDATIVVRLELASARRAEASAALAPFLSKPLGADRVDIAIESAQ